jgi:hypothetical protein
VHREGVALRDGVVGMAGLAQFGLKRGIDGLLELAEKGGIRYPPREPGGDNVVRSGAGAAEATCKDAMTPPIASR